MHISTIIGKGVLDKNANTVGKVTDFDIDVSSWTINQCIVKSGIIKKSSFGVDKIEKVGDKVFLRVTREELEK